MIICDALRINKFSQNSLLLHYTQPMRYSRSSKILATSMIARLALNHNRFPCGHTRSTTKFRTHARVARVRRKRFRASGKCRWTHIMWKAMKVAIAHIWINAFYTTTIPTKYSAGYRKISVVTTNKTVPLIWWHSNRIGSKSRNWNVVCINSWIGLPVCKYCQLLVFIFGFYFPIGFRCTRNICLR